MSYDRLKQHSRDEMRKLKEQHEKIVAGLEAKHAEQSNRLKREVNDGRVRMANMQTEMDELRTDNEEMHESGARLSENGAELEARCAALQADCERMRERVQHAERVQQQLDAVTRQGQQLHAQCNDMRTALQAEQAKVVGTHF